MLLLFDFAYSRCNTVSSELGISIIHQDNTVLSQASAAIIKDMYFECSSI